MSNLLDPVQLLWKEDVSLSDGRFNGDYIHVSGLSAMCPRAYYFASQLKNHLICKQVFSTATKITFTMGRALEKYFREQFIKGHGIENILGMWKGELRFGTNEDTLDDFEEIEIRDEHFKLIGHVDWVYRDTNGKLTVLEIKSISKGRFESELTNGPIIDHVVQVLSYLKMLTADKRIKDLGVSFNKLAHIYYMCKDHRFRAKTESSTVNPMYRCFSVHFDKYKSNLQRAWTTAKDTIKAIKENKMPDRVICDTYLKAPAKECPFVCRCFMKESKCS